jgi:uncharacterized protein YggU (UPF0235/DUF167 family)
MIFWRAGEDSVTVMVKVRPRSRRPGFHGVQASMLGPRLTIAVTEVAEDGRANRAVCAALAEALDVAKSSVHIVSGASGREKLMSVAGDPTALEEKLRSL